MDRHHIRTPHGGQPPMQVMLERAALGLGLPDAALAAQEQRLEAERIRRESLMAKVRDGRWDALTPAERGRIIAALAAECPDA
ncbi:hypothetical protein [Sorangium sp. So ce388]|uniref:hypothetical protein n=1 Tax=Sorangium sp. So ce388 TaxID=3133309 RepID=UPI003F5AE818